MTLFPFSSINGAPSPAGSELVGLIGDCARVAALIVGSSFLSRWEETKISRTPPRLNLRSAKKVETACGGHLSKARQVPGSKLRIQGIVLVFGKLCDLKCTSYRLLPCLDLVLEYLSWSLAILCTSISFPESGIIIYSFATMNGLAALKYEL
jgi:hypothetical protein